MRIIILPVMNEIAAGNTDGGSYTAGIIIAVPILLFLLYTLLKPEKF